ncbi:MAG: DUF1667 domain-containing protein [Atopobiaceae bacterium]|jgi:CxxC motif-containing protein|nr:DUF1667 domain-containing protein [Atopobiaceae bacterium]MCH4119575.1 DUF1667 domain-containing protein [Atopobiaceae bacterium]MCI1318636.1 DUF1667 domain-containing protein [Atopobiaceae bacterium]MCI1389540.1 DUF1667 domain-containing protein [Atopobiaceae bacterium]MCI1431604.1 DUF1667 domain-containing protein [Atopobiaceae bacterium]
MATETKSFTCVQCPMGCPLTVTLEDGVVKGVTGNTCPRGAKYGAAGATHPERVVTSLVGVVGDHHPVSVKTAGPVPKETVDAVLDQISATEVRLPVHIGDVVVRDVAGTGVDVVCTKSRER